MGEACQLIRIWKASGLWICKNFYNLDRNKEKRILKEIEGIEFPHLQILDLEGNELESVEGLNRMFFPQLKELVLSNWRYI